jgi:hypothetical protein
MADAPGVIGGKRAGVPSPEGNPKIKQVYGRGAGKLKQNMFGADGNLTLIPVATWDQIRIHINISLAGVLSIALADGEGVEIGSRVAASQRLVATGPSLSNGDTCTLGTKTYTFQTTLTDVDGNVALGSTYTESLANLAAAINLGEGAGTAYAASMTLNDDAYAVLTAADIMWAYAKLGGTSGNSIASTETSSNLAWNGTTLTGGVDGDLAGDETAIVADTPLIVDIPGIHGTTVEHCGEPYLLIGVAELSADADVVVFDVMGSSW